MRTQAHCAASRSRGTCVSSRTDQNGTEIDQGFDDLDRLTAREPTLASGVGGDTDESFEYDAMNRLVEAADNDSIVQFTYDSLSRVLTEVQGSNPLGTTGKTVSYTWDAESNRDGAPHASAHRPTAGRSAASAHSVARRCAVGRATSSAFAASSDCEAGGSEV